MSAADDSMQKLRVAIEPQTQVLAGRPGDEALLPVRITNLSLEAVRAGNFAFELTSRVMTVVGHSLDDEQTRFLVDEPLPPGASRDVFLPVRVPSDPGLYYVQVEVLRAATRLLSEECNPPAVVKLLASRASRSAQWRLDTHDGSVAYLERPSDPHGEVRVTIAGSPGTAAYHIQLNLTGLCVDEGERYEIRFRARADAPRTMAVGFAKAHHPWNGIGLYQLVALSRVWADFVFGFAATASEGNARLHFDLGGDAAAVDVAGATVTAVGDPSRPVTLPIHSLPARLAMNIGVQPLSRAWGTDRGLPIHRAYIEQFLTEHASDVRGRCLEFQNPAYCPRFGGDTITRLDILHVDDTNTRATLIADLSKPNDLPSDAFDCIICTHVLQLILDLHTAVSELYRILKPGGVLLVGEPHVSMASDAYQEIWRFTPHGMRAVLGRAFGADNVAVHAFGNALVTAGDLRGLVVNEFTRAELDRHDRPFAVEVCARAIKR